MRDEFKSSSEMVISALFSLFGQKACLISTKQSILSRTTKEDEQVNSYRFTTVREGTYGHTVVLAGFEIICSSLGPRARDLGNLHGAPINTQMRVNCWVKWSKIL